MSPPLRAPGSVGSTSRRRAPIASALDRRRNQHSFPIVVDDVEQSGDAIHRRAPSTSSAAAANDRVRSTTSSLYPRPPFAQSRVRPTLPRHLPPCLRAGQRPGDGDGVGLFLEPDRRADEDVAQRHAALAGAGRVLGEVGVDERPGAAGPGHHPVDDEDQSSVMAQPSSRDNSRQTCCRACCAMSSIGIVMNPWMPPSNRHRAVTRPPLRARRRKRCPRRAAGRGRR